MAELNIVVVDLSLPEVGSINRTWVVDAQEQ
jgi:hypothetical protein